MKQTKQSLMALVWGRGEECWRAVPELILPSRPVSLLYACAVEVRAGHEEWVNPRRAGWSALTIQLELRLMIPLALVGVPIPLHGKPVGRPETLGWQRRSRRRHPRVVSLASCLLPSMLPALCGQRWVPHDVPRTGHNILFDHPPLFIWGTLPSLPLRSSRFLLAHGNSLSELFILVVIQHRYRRIPSGSLSGWIA